MADVKLDWNTTMSWRGSAFTFLQMKKEDQCRHVKHYKPPSTDSEGVKWKNCFLRAQTCRIWRRSSTIASMGFSHRYNQRRPLANMRRRINEALLGEENNVDMGARQESRRARTTAQVDSSSAGPPCSLRRLRSKRMEVDLSDQRDRGDVSRASLCRRSVLPA